MSRLIVLVTLLAAGTAVSAGEIGYVEDFALAKDRVKALEKLIPGTEDYYYYHCLHYQHTEQFDKVDDTLKAWIKRYKYTARVKEIQNRQALLTYARNPEASLTFLRQRLGLTFAHQRERLNQKPNLPTALDQKLIGRAALAARAYRTYQNLNGFENRALDWLVATNLNADRRRNLLQRLQRPDHAGLPKLIVDDLNYKYSRNFGSFGIHQQLLLVQLDECLKLKSDLLNQTAFVNAYLSKLRPNADVDWRNDPAEQQAYLERLQSFVEKLAPVHNSLKTHVLYRRLVLDRSQGIYNKQRFMQYIKLPRNASYVNPKYLQSETHRRFRADLNANFSAVTLFPPVANDEPLVRSYLHRFFVKETTYKPYEPYINDVYLKHNFAETKIVNGLGEAEQWYSLLPPAQYQTLKERIDIDFTPTNKTLFGPDAAITLDVDVKNVEKLIVKVYEINTFNYYRDKGREVDTDINLDGLVPNQETTHSYTEPPLRRVRRRFEFPLLKNRGVYVIDFIGNGKSSRALIRKGRLHYLVRTGVAGHVFTVLDEQNRKLNDAAVQLAGHLYRPSEDGTITVPFSTYPARQPIVLKHEELSSLAYFHHEAENYRLTTGMFVDRESLLKRQKAQVIIRPSLTVNGTPVTLSVLEDVRLAITSTDHDGVVSTQEVPNFKLFEDRESVHEFQVPGRLSSLRFSLTAKVKNLSQGRTITLQAGHSVTLNQIDKTDKIEDLHFTNIDGRYVVDLLGRTGEPKADRPVQFSIKHRDFKRPVAVTLESDERGRVLLGPLADIAWVKATTPAGTAHTWNLLSDAHTYHHEVHGVAGQSVRIPYMGAKNAPTRDEISLLELRGGTFLADRFESVSIKNGQLQISNLPRGDYDLLLKQSGERIRLRFAAGERRLGYVLGENRNLEVRNAAPLQIESVKAGEKNLTIQLRNASKFARVHLFATRYQPAFNAYANLATVRDPEPYQIPRSRALSLFVEGRNIGDEYRYIIDRKYAHKYPGLMLKRPGLLLNPWAIRQTQTTDQRPEAGDSFGGAGVGGSLGAKRAASKSPAPSQQQDFANLDFLSSVSAVQVNLVADKNGVITVPRIVLGGRQYLHIVAVDPQNTAYRTLTLPETDTPYLDLRLAKGMNPDEHYTLQKRISVVPAGGTFVIGDVTTSRFEAYDSLPAAYRLYATLSGNPTLAEFNFIVNWHKLTDEQKREKYSKYACHELTFFVSKRDPKFYRQSVLPYLAHKKDRTFLDEWFLKENMPAYLAPWAHGRMNVVEQILLAQHIAGERPATSRHVTDLFDLIPPNIDRFNLLFETAVKGGALNTADAFGFDSAKSELSATFRLRGLKAPAPGKPGEAKAAPPSPNDAPMNARPDSRSSKTKSRKKALTEEMEEAVGKLSRRRAGRAGNRDIAESYLFQLDLKERQMAKQLYRKLEKTKEWVENNYYQLPIEQQNAALITVNGFWRDFAAQENDAPLNSVNMAEASRNFAEMMFALSLLDLPAEAREHKTEFAGTQMTLTAGSPMIVYHEEILPARGMADETPILVSQNFFRHGDRFRYVSNERVDKYVRDEFLVHVVYGCQVVVTNPTSTPQKLNVLLQIPEGAVPVLNGRYTRNANMNLQPYNTQTLEYYFYFPVAGNYRHYPVQVAKNEQLIAHAESLTFNVVDEPSEIDRESWDFVSQQGSDDDLIDYLKRHNLHRTKLDRIAFRMQDQAFFGRVMSLLTARHVYNHTLWSYGVKHNVTVAAAEYLQHANAFVAATGSYIDSPLLTIDPVARNTYQHMEYRPLVNARAHQLGRRRRILNNRFDQQYHRLMKTLTYHRSLDDVDLLAVTYYMLLQDRVGEALQFFGRVNPENLQTKLQYDYLSAYVDLYTGDTVAARIVATKYAAHPVDRWRKAFTAVLAQLDEIEGADIRLVDTEARTETQTKLAASESGFNFKVESKQIKLNFQNLQQVQVNYYLMDVELLFSRNPFVQQQSGQFAYIRPNATQSIELPQGQVTATFDLPEQLHNSNVLVEIVGGGQTQSQAYYSNSLNLQVIENYGHVRVAHSETGKPVPTTYVKVYARMNDGRLRFYKDGYTDLRGRFDFTSLNTDELNSVQRFSLLIMSEEHGAIVREAAPPKQ
jgi:hypothetical protein